MNYLNPYLNDSLLLSWSNLDIPVGVEIFVNNFIRMKMLCIYKSS